MNEITIDDIMKEVVADASKAKRVEPIVESKPERQETLAELTSWWESATKKESTSVTSAITGGKPFLGKEEVIDFYLRRIVSEPYMSFALLHCFGVPSMEGYEIGKNLALNRIPVRGGVKYVVEQEIVFFSRLLATLNLKGVKHDVIEDADKMLHSRLVDFSSITAAEERHEQEEQEAEFKRNLKRAKK